MEPKQHLILLAELLGKHLAVSHWAISMRVMGKGDFFERLMAGKDCQLGTYQRAMKRFAE